MDKKYSGLEEHIQLLFFHGLLVQHKTKLTKLCGLEYHRSRVHCIECSSLQSSVVSQTYD
jgi:hypothetical protein